jgi:hypothetical protein
MVLTVSWKMVKDFWSCSDVILNILRVDHEELQSDKVSKPGSLVEEWVVKLNKRLGDQFN